MYISDNPHVDFDRWDSACEKKRAKLPTCECCREPIQDEELFDFDDELVCSYCVSDYIDEKFKKKTNRYMEE